MKDDLTIERVREIATGDGYAAALDHGDAPRLARALLRLLEAERETPSEAEARDTALALMSDVSPAEADAAIYAYRAAVLRAEREEAVALVERLREWCEFVGVDGSVVPEADDAVRDADAWLAKRSS